MVAEPDQGPAPAAPPAAPQLLLSGPRRFNAIYERLVKEPGDLVGMIAYALYKDSKRDWIRRFEDEEKRRPNLEETFSGYVRAQGEGELTRLRNQAEALLAAYSDVVLNRATPAIRREALETEALERARQLNSDVEVSVRWGPPSRFEPGS